MEGSEGSAIKTSGVGGDTQAPANMAPVLNMLDSWGAETPFAQISESAVGGSVLAVRNMYVCVCVCVIFCCIC